MKKVISILLLSLFIVGCNNKIEIEEPKIDSLKENYNRIEKVIAIKISIGGRTCYDVTEYKDNIYNSIINMKATEKTEEYTRDDGLIYNFVLNDSNITFEFNNGSYVKSLKEMYKLEKTHYEIKYDKEIECDY